MRLEVNSFEKNGQELYEYSLVDGPDEHEVIRGYASDMVNVFAKVMEWRDRISRDYSTETTETKKNIETNN